MIVGLFYFVLFSQILCLRLHSVVKYWRHHCITFLDLPFFVEAVEARQPDNTILEVIVMRAARAARIGARAGRLSRVGVPRRMFRWPKNMAKFGKVCTKFVSAPNLLGHWAHLSSLGSDDGGISGGCWFYTLGETWGRWSQFDMHISTRYLNGHHLVSVRGSQWNRFQ